MAQLRQIRPATADGSGNITFTFPPVNVNSAWVGTISVPQAPVTAEFLVMIADQNHGGWSASSPFGQVTANGSEQIVVTGTGMTPGVQFNCVMLGQIIPGGSIQTSPQPTTSKVLVAGIPGAVPVAVTINQTAPLEDTLFRSDGRAYPLGTNAASFDWATNSETIIPAQGAALYVLIHSIVPPIGYAAAGFVSQLRVMKGGIPVTVCGGAGPVNAAGPSSGVYQPPGGLLCDVNTAVSLVTTVAADKSSEGAIYWDQVA